MAGAEQLPAAWKQAFPLLKCKSRNTARLDDNLSLLHHNGFTHMLLAYAIRQAKNRIKAQTIPRFWTHYDSAANQNPTPEEERKLVHLLIQSMQQLHSALNDELEYLTYILEQRSDRERFDTLELVACARTELLLLVQTDLINASPHVQAFDNWAAACWRRLFQDAASGARRLEQSQSNPSSTGDGDGESFMDISDEETDVSGGIAQLAVGQLQTLSTLLKGLNWSALTEASLAATLDAQTCAALLQRCVGTFGEPCLTGELRRIEKHVRPWLKLVIGGDDVSGARLEQWTARSCYIVRQSLASLRISELFDIIVDFPDSMSALDDLAECLRHTQQHSELIGALGRAISRRLLQPGATTANIIQVYISMIRALQRLDQSGLILEALSEPVRSYLKARGDTVRQIVTSLTDPESSDWLDPTIDVEKMQAPQPSDLYDDENSSTRWEPAPMQSDAGGTTIGLGAGSAVSTGGFGSSVDVLTILVNIYGSKALFVNEFRTMLADKLLTSTADADTEREVRNLELLKKRFGDSAMQTCEVMLTDVAESRRLSQSISRHFGGEPIGGSAFCMLDVMVTSRLCWPQLPSETFEFPSEIASEMARFEKQFMHLRAPRKLVWRPSLGFVTLDVHFPDQTLQNVTCTPLQATILLKFADRDAWTISELAESLRVDPSTLRRRLGFWLQRGIVQKVAHDGEEDVFEAASSLGAANSLRAAADDEEDASAASSLREEQLAAEMRVYEQYVVGMLTNLESLPLQRIHNMLKMFVPASGNEQGYDRTEQELQRFLNHLVENGKLELSGGQYRVRK